MPQLDVLVFKYQNLSFILSFFIFFFFNQYVFYPKVIRSFFFRKKLLSANVLSDSSKPKIFLLVANFNLNTFDSFIFVSVESIYLLAKEKLNKLYNFINFFFILKYKNYYAKLLNNLCMKFLVLVFVSSSF